MCCGTSETRSLAAVQNLSWVAGIAVTPHAKRGVEQVNTIDHPSQLHHILYITLACTYTSHSINRSAYPSWRRRPKADGPTLTKPSPHTVGQVFFNGNNHCPQKLIQDGESPPSIKRPDLLHTSMAISVTVLYARTTTSPGRPRRMSIASSVHEQ